MDNLDINTLLAKHFSGETTTDEEASLLTWIKENPDEYISLKTFWVESEQSGSLQLFETDKAWERIAPSVLSPKPTLFQRYKKYVYAAAILVFISTFAFLYGNAEITVKTVEGQVKNVSLSDGSIISLNEHSSITYKRFFWNTRAVSLNGEAFFKVKRDPDKPFSVNTDQLLVRVLGTSFVVRTTEKEKMVAVITGKVGVTSIPDKQTAVLKKNNTVYYVADKFIKSDQNDENLLSWQTKRLSFKNTSLQKAFQDIEKCYHVKINVEGKIPDSCTITTRFDKESIKEVLEELRLLFGLTYTQKDNIIWIKNLSCSK